MRSRGLAAFGVAVAALTAMILSFLAVSRWLEGGGRAAPAPFPGVAAAPAAPPAPPAAVPDPAPADLDPEEWVAEAARTAEAREQALRERFLAIADAEDTTIDYKLDRYLRTLRDTYEGTPQEGLLEARGMLTEAFLRIESVQRDLAALDPGARAQELARIRREMGFDEEGVARAAALDAERQVRWDRGHAYMEERRRLTGTFEGEALDAELEALRERTFGHEAETIAREEEQGFFRYERPRVHGRN